VQQYRKAGGRAVHRVVDGALLLLLRRRERITREFYAVYAAEELARLHRKYSPVAHLFVEEEDV